MSTTRTMRFKFSAAAVLVLIVSLTLVNCGGGGGGGSAEGGNTVSAENSVVTAIRNSAPVNACPQGGIQVDAGIDDNGNSVLDASEIDSTQYVCNGANGSSGLTVLVSVANEPAGTNCASGGKKISAGNDANTNSVLDAGEITSSDYVCNGATGPAGPGVTWVNVTGTSVQAESNTGYMANNAASQVTITVPAAPAVGDIVQVSGIGAGGWKIAQNAGQSIITQNIPRSIGAVWTACESNRSWRSIASSSDGTRLAAGLWNGQIYTSTDSGVTWTAREASRYWRSIASSSDGTRLAAVAEGGQIYTSTDSGVTWTARESSRGWISIASSSDGTRLAAGVWNGQIYTSTDSGVTWTARESSRGWFSIASSSDGTKLAAVVYGGQIYTSTDSGVSWTARESSRSWYSIASSSDGTRLAAVAYGGQIYTSTDSGVSWTASESNRNWYSIASSSDGTRLAAVAYRGQIYTSEQRTTIGTAGSISGGQYDAIELQHVGNNTFSVLSHEGELVIQ